MLSLAMSRWMGCVEKKKQLVRVADKALLRWQHMCLAPVWARWEEHWREEKRDVPLRPLFGKRRSLALVSSDGRRQWYWRRRSSFLQ
jgi:hypothetical protein